jgi:hypothetical protein
MARQVQIRRGTTAQHQTFIGVPAELTVDTDKNVLIVHDGNTVGGNPVAKAVDPEIRGNITLLDSNAGVAFADGTVQRSAAKEAFYFAYPGTLYSPISTGSRYYPEVNITISTIVASIGTPSSSDIVIQIRVNESQVNEITIPAGEFRLFTNFSLSQSLYSLASTSYVTVDILQGGGANLTLKFNYIRS